MLELAVVTREETYHRMRDPLLDRDINTRFIQSKERILPLTTKPSEFTDIDVGWIFPSRLMEGGVIDTLLEVNWVNDREAVLTSRNKAGVLTQLHHAGIPVPNTMMISNPVDEHTLQSVFQSFDGPVVVKPNSATRGMGIIQTDDLDSFMGITDYFSLLHTYQPTADRSFLVQEFIPDARDYRVMVVDEEYVGAVERRVDGAETRWKRNVHQAAIATAVELPGDLQELAEQVANILDITVLGVDLLVSDDRTVVIETNARPTIDNETKYEPGFYDKLAIVVKSRV